MTIKQQASLPFADNFPVTVQLRIRPSDREYVAEIQADWGSWHRIPIGLKQNDVADINADLSQTIEQVSIQFDATTPEPETLREAIARLAYKGNFAYKSIFAASAVRDTLTKMLSCGATIQVSSEEFFIPWELLYDGPLGLEADGSRFWGMQYVISRALIQDARPGDYVSPVIHSSCPNVGLIACHDLPQVDEQEIPMLKKLHQERRILLLSLRPLNSNQFDNEVKEFKRFVENELEIAHLACHAAMKQPLSQSYFLVSEQFPISVEDFHVHDIQLKNNPLVLLNACRTGTMDPRYSANWAAVFWSRGARGVLATEFSVPDTFAAAFIGQVYWHLLSGIPIGAGLLNTRQYFWNTKQNPLGLAYALYSSPSIRIQK